jgi:hypothetical protein
MGVADTKALVARLRHVETILGEMMTGRTSKIQLALWEVRQVLAALEATIPSETGSQLELDKALATMLRPDFGKPIPSEGQRTGADDAGAKLLADLIGYSWDGLNETSAEHRGFPIWSHGQFSPSYQGGKEHLRKVAAQIAALSPTVSGEAEPVAWTRDDLAISLAALDGIVLHEIRSTVGAPEDANHWREYLGRADDLMARLSWATHLLASERAQVVEECARLLDAKAKIAVAAAATSAPEPNLKRARHYRQCAEAIRALASPAGEEKR